jgi:hypothetical protein
LQVFKAFKEISSISGDKSQDRKKNLIVKLLAGAKDEEAGYVMRALQVGGALPPDALLLSLIGGLTLIGAAVFWGWLAGWLAALAALAQRCGSASMGCLSTIPEPCLLCVCLLTTHPAAVPQGKLRIGLAEQTVLVALAHAVMLQKEGVSGSSEEVAGQLEQAAQIVKQVGRWMDACGVDPCRWLPPLPPSIFHHGLSQCCTAARTAFTAAAGVQRVPLLRRAHPRPAGAPAGGAA